MVINIIKDNKSDSKQPVVYDLGTVTTTLQALLDNSRITITDKQVILLKVTQDATVSYYFLPFKDYNGDSLYGYGKEIVVSDLIPIGSGGGAATTPNLGEVLTQGNRAPLAVNANRVFTLEDRTKNLYSLFNLSTTVSLTLNNSVAYDLGDVLKIQHYVGVDGSEVSTMNLVFDSVTVFYGNDLITSFSIPYGAVAYLEKILPSVWTLSYKLAQDIGGSGTPYIELIFTAVQTAPQTGITSGTLIEGGRYIITGSEVGTDFIISGAPDNVIGTTFIANAVEPEWGTGGMLDFTGNPVVTILNNPLSDTYSSHYTAAGTYYLEGLLDFPANTFPKLGNYVDVVQQSPYDFTGIGQSSYLWYKNPSNDKQIMFRSGASGDLTDNILDGTQLFIVKIFNS